MLFLEHLAILLGKAMKMAKAMHADHEDSEGPSYFAKCIVEGIAGKTEHEMYDSKFRLPEFTEKFPFIQSMATRATNLFIDGVADMPRKTFFGVASGMDLAVAKLEHLKHVRLDLQDRIFEDSESKKETKFLITAHGDPPDETIKVRSP